jgi:hypothetical protein
MPRHYLRQVFLTNLKHCPVSPALLVKVTKSLPYSFLPNIRSALPTLEFQSLPLHDDLDLAAHVDPLMPAPWGVTTICVLIILKYQ